MHKTKPRLLVGTGMLFVAAGALAQAVIRTDSGWAVALPGLFLVGVGAGLVLGPLSAAAMAAVPGPRAGMAAGAVNTFRQLGYALGIAVLGEVFRSALEHTGGPMRHVYAVALDRTFMVAAGLGLVAGIAVFLFVRPRTAPSAERLEAASPKPQLQKI
jgi:MFS family permease